MKKSWPVFVLLLSILAAAPARADGPPDDLKRLIGKSADSTQNGAEKNNAPDDGIIRITPDATKVVRLEEDASSIVVNNPAIAAVVLDSPRLLVVMPRQPGATSFTVLNGDGETIMEKTVIVTATAKPDYVRIHRACGASDAGCVPYAYYYCPDGCYEVSPVGAAQTGATIPPVVNNNGGGAAGAPVEQGSGPVVTNGKGLAPGVSVVPGQTLLPGEQ